MTDAKNEQIVTNHKVVTFTYTIMDDEGNVQEQSDIPMAYVHGVDDRVIPKIAESIEGHKVGDEMFIEVQPKEGFGEHDESLMFRDSINNVPQEFQHIGAEATFQNDNGEQRIMRVVKIDDDTIEMDGNHPYAGQTMTFKIIIKDVRDATKDEIGSGQASSTQSQLH